MLDRSLKFLRDLLHTPSPSGYERSIQDLVRGWAKPLADEVRTDRHGNVIAIRYAKDRKESAPRIMLAGHCDQIALMVQYIDENGFLYVQPIGGWDMQLLLGQYLTVWAKDGPDHRRRVPQGDASADAGRTSQGADLHRYLGGYRRQGQSRGRVGRPPGRYGHVRTRHARSCEMDSPRRQEWTTKSESGRSSKRCDSCTVGALNASVYVVSTVQEELGLRGATTSSYGIHPTVGIAVDVTHATDTPGNDKKLLGDTKLGDGPVLYRGANINPRVFEKLEATAKAHELPVQVRGAPRATGTDANAIQLSRDGVAAALVSIPNRYMHSPVEVVALTDLERAAKLLAEFCATVSPDDDWTP